MANGFIRIILCIFVSSAFCKSCLPSTSLFTGKPAADAQGIPFCKFDWLHSLDHRASLGLEYAAESDSFTGCSTSSLSSSSAVGKKKLHIYVQKSENILDDVATLGLTTLQALKLLCGAPQSNDSSSVQDILLYLCENGDFSKQLVIGFLQAESVDSSMEDTLTGEKCGKVHHVANGWILCGIVQGNTEISTAQIKTFVNGAVKLQSLSEFQNLLEHLSTSPEGKFHAATLFRVLDRVKPQKPAHELTLANLLQQLCQAQNEVRSTEKLFGHPLLREVAYLHETFSTALQFSQNKIMMSKVRIGNNLGTPEALNDCSLSMARFDWLPSVQEFLDVYSELAKLSKQEEFKAAVGKTSCNVTLIFPSEVPKLLQWEKYFENFSLSAALSATARELQSILKVVVDNANGKWQICIRHEVQSELKISTHVHVEKLDLKVSTLDSFLEYQDVDSVSASSNAIKLTFLPVSTDFDSNKVQGVAIQFREDRTNKPAMEIMQRIDRDGGPIVVENLKAGTSYLLSYQTIRQLGRCIVKSVMPVSTKACGAPTISSVQRLSPFHVRLEVSPPEFLPSNAKLVLYQITMQEQRKYEKAFIKADAFKPITIEVNDDGLYAFAAAAVLSDDSVGEESCQVSLDVKLTSQERMKHSIVHSSLIIDSSRAEPIEYELQMDQTFSDPEHLVRKMELGQSGVSGVDEKVIMIVGETGCGKTTLINSMVNYIFGVKYEDPFRFRIITDPKEKKLQASQSMSQTQWVTSYTFHHREGCQQPCTLTLVDTPGFGDTGGIMKDKEIVDRIREFFSSPGGIDHLDAVGFVVPSSVARLTPTQRYVFDSILSLFGKDIGENIYMLITFADANVPPVLESLKEAGISYNLNIKFNNSAVFAKSQDMDQMSQMFNKMFWEMGMNSFQCFFVHLMQMKAKSLTLTKDVLSERQRLQTHLIAIKNEIDQGLSKLNQLEREISVIKTHQSDLDRNSDFTYTVVEDKVTCEPIPSGTYITNCLTCQKTCHYPCGIPDDNNKAGCAAMTNGRCHVCSSGCVWSVHKNMNYRIVIVQQTVTKTSDDLKGRYTDAEGKLLTAKQLALRVYEEYLGTKVNVMQLVKESKECIERLRKIALKPDPLNEVDYIDKLIDAENMNKSHGYSDRVQQLQDIRELAVRAENLKKDELLNVLLQSETRVYDKYEEFFDKPNTEGIAAHLWEGCKRLTKRIFQSGKQA